MSLVLELQREAVAGNSSINNLLRKALLVAKKLKVHEFEKWVLSEMNGYARFDEIPDYREVRGNLKAWNPYHGYIPYIIQNSNFYDEVSTKKMDSSVGELEHILEGSDGTVIIKFHAELENFLMKSQEFPFQPSLHISDSQFKKIVETVRGIVLNWSLQLEEDGILGEGMSFSKNEEEKAVKSTEQIIHQNIYNSGGGHIQVQQLTQHSTQSLEINSTVDKSELSALIIDLKKLLDEMTNGDIKDELDSEVTVLEAQVKSPKPKPAMIAEALKSIRNISEGITGSLIATAIVEKIPMIVSKLPL
ncbi:AbiTii domain-containing protein [Ferdinandcohnia sp. SAFN-114]|uniref:AbiTii domain-containing protein n=1 Tax=Ferdinandcohnia sp. SAFN-114 TaxID=3387275 RepID=UPI003F7FC804